MAESARRRLLPWGSVLTLVALAIGLLRAFPNDPETDWLLPPLNLWAAFVMVAAVFLIERRLNRYFWGLAAAVVLIMHPTFQRQFVQASNPALLAEGLVLAALACTLLAWDLTFLPDFAWWSWLVVNVALCLCIGTSWVVQAPAGLRATLLAVAGIGTAYLLGRCWQRWPVASAPSWWNVGAAALTTVVAPVGGCLLVPRIGRLIGWLHNSMSGAPPDLRAMWSDTFDALRKPHWREFSRPQLDLWCWPWLWLVLPVLTWALWRTLRGGWKQRRCGQAPLPWLLTLYTVLTLLVLGLLPAADPRTEIVALTPLVVLLVVFCLADLVRGALDRLVLRPPE